MNSTGSSAVAGALYTRLMEKIDHNLDDIIRVEEYMLDDADTAVVCFGGTTRAVMSAIEQARAEGMKVGMFRPITVWPFPEARLRARLHSLKKVLVAEHNYGQMLLEVQRVAAEKLPVEFIGRYDGTVIAPAEILEKLREMEG